MPHIPNTDPSRLPAAYTKLARVYQQRCAAAITDFAEATNRAAGAWLDAAKPLAPAELWCDAALYASDFAQRSLLFWDTLRRSCRFGVCDSLWAIREGVDVCCGVVWVASGVGAGAGGLEGADLAGVRPVGSAGDGRGFPGRAFVGRGAQDRLASGRAGGPGAALPHPVTAGAQSLGGRCSAGSRARLRDRGAWGRGRGSGYRRDGVREEGRALGGCFPPVFRHGGTDRELPGWRVPGVCQPFRTSPDRPASLSS